MKSNNVNATIVARGNGAGGKLIVTSRGHKRTIPAVLFSSRESQTLLSIVDNFERKRTFLGETGCTGK